MLTTTGKRLRYSAPLALAMLGGLYLGYIPDDLTQHLLRYLAAPRNFLTHTPTHPHPHTDLGGLT
jgi:hypothetical protein